MATVMRFCGDPHRNLLLEQCSPQTRRRLIKNFPQSLKIKYKTGYTSSLPIARITKQLVKAFPGHGLSISISRLTGSIT